jgi:segregation and condensation protein A
VWSLAQARTVLERLIGISGDWAQLDEFLIAYVVEPALRPTVLASSFAATLEMVREGSLEVHQQRAFAPIYLRRRVRQANDAARPDVAGPSRETP